MLSQIIEHRTLSKLALVGAFVFTAAEASATNLTSWNFAAAAGNEATYEANGGDSSNFDLSVLITRGPSAGPAATHAGSFWASGWGGGPDLDAYFEFSVNPLAGAVYTVTDVSFTGEAVVGGPNAWMLAYMIGSTPIVLGIVPSDPDYTVSGTVPVGLTGLSTPMTFRIYGYGNEGGAGGLNTLQINGIVEIEAGGGNGVPETMPLWTLGLIAAGLMGAAGLAQRRSASSAPARINHSR